MHLYAVFSVGKPDRNLALAPDQHCLLICLTAEDTPQSPQISEDTLSMATAWGKQLYCRNLFRQHALVKFRYTASQSIDKLPEQWRSL